MGDASAAASVGAGDQHAVEKKGQEGMIEGQVLRRNNQMVTSGDFL